MATLKSAQERTAAIMELAKEFYAASKIPRKMGTHWHVMNFLLALAPSAIIILAVKDVKRKDDVPWVGNNRQLQDRISTLEKQILGDAVDLAPSAREERKQHPPAAGTPLPELLDRLKSLEASVQQLQAQNEAQAAIIAAAQQAVTAPTITIKTPAAAVASVAANGTPVPVVASK